MPLGALQDILASARSEFATQGASLTVPRDYDTQEAAIVRVSLAETRSAMEVIHTHAKVKSLNIQTVLGHPGHGQQEPQ